MDKKKTRKKREAKEQTRQEKKDTDATRNEPLKI